MPTLISDASLQAELLEVRDQLHLQANMIQLAITKIYDCIPFGLVHYILEDEPEFDVSKYRFLWQLPIGRQDPWSDQDWLYFTTESSTKSIWLSSLVEYRSGHNRNYVRKIGSYISVASHSCAVRRIAESVGCSFGLKDYEFVDLLDAVHQVHKWTQLEVRAAPIYRQMLSPDLHPEFRRR